MEWREGLTRKVVAVTKARRPHTVLDGNMIAIVVAMPGRTPISLESRLSTSQEQWCSVQCAVCSVQCAVCSRTTGRRCTNLPFVQYSTVQSSREIADPAVPTFALPRRTSSPPRKARTGTGVVLPSTSSLRSHHLLVRPHYGAPLHVCLSSVGHNAVSSRRPSWPPQISSL